LSRFYPKARGWALTFHHSAGSFGSFIGPGLASLALLYMGWRTAFVVFGLPSLVMGLALFLVREHASAADDVRGAKGNFKANIDAYRTCLKDRNIVFTSLVLMVGAAGRGTGINLTYLVPFFMERFDVSAPVGGLFLTLLQGAGLVGPLAIAWFSDRLGRRAIVTQATLLLSAVMTVWLAYQTSLGALFYLNLVLYGSVVEARSSLTQTMISDYAKADLTDAAFSIYYFVGCISGPIWTLIVGYVGVSSRRIDLHRRHVTADVRQGSAQTREILIEIRAMIRKPHRREAQRAEITRRQYQRNLAAMSVSQ
jgi:MFS family permease